MAKEEIKLEEFTNHHIKQLIEMLNKEDDTGIKGEFIYPYMLEQLNAEQLRLMFEQFAGRNDRYAALKIVLVTNYGWKSTIGTAHITQLNCKERRGILAKFYVNKTYRKGGFEERCLVEIMKFAFDTMDLDKLIVFIKEDNEYYSKLLIYLGFKLMKIKYKSNGLNRMQLGLK